MSTYACTYSTFYMPATESEGAYWKRHTGTSKRLRLLWDLVELRPMTDVTPNQVTFRISGDGKFGFAGPRIV